MVIKGTSTIMRADFGSKRVSFFNRLAVGFPLLVGQNLKNNSRY